MNKRNIARASFTAISLLVLSSCAQVTQPELCDSSITPIYAIQGDGFQSPVSGQQVTTRGIVTANWQSEAELGGFFIASEQADRDDNALTSEGLFVQASANLTSLKQGDLVYLTGTVAELNELTQLTNLSQHAVCDSGYTVEPTSFQLPVTAKEQFEALEGMPVQISQELVVNGHYQLLRHGQFDVAHERLYTPTQHHQPGAEAQSQAKANALARLVIDDNLAPNSTIMVAPKQNITATNSLRSGDSIGPVQGIISDFRGSYRLQPTSQISVVTTNPRPAAPEAPTTNTLRVAAFNVLNYFNGEGENKQFPTERGAKTAAEFERQHQKIIAALGQLNADIIGLLELENDGYASHSAIVELTTALTAATGQPWRYVQAAPGKFGSDDITNGLIYRSDKVTPQGQPLTVTQAPFGQRSRLPLIQRFSPKNTVENVVVAVNHFKSKGGCPKDNSDPNANQSDGQACWNKVRVQSAKALADFIDNHEDLKRFPLRVLMGDFNAYAQEDPIQTLLQRGYYNRIDAFNPHAYSYVYDAQAGSLDHLLVSSQLAARVVYQAIWSINADEPTLLQYNNADANPNWYAPSPYRASDHDPIYADIQF
ncbi:ExeM/NucH family extracellular endonuclease [Pseudidiomarina andamanensis]|uniref:ExeM/NucH family extracellular endonuclease n=1 Tax=Pseudidiomarina andamanensis TaxID=1940690 RepID=A0AA92ILN7_9GAMM|nr:ExeM/NucH family extracellular endonuclease [Pseudidiomarina andamanensis]MDS0218578.1 ExeM/NucH family extracellular endonuclease [Pseudidiomarina andamanensis]QGT95444.1 ExeM/NucH family extracellular endonuclease [Pseudidiomarina andamanensis]